MSPANLNTEVILVIPLVTLVSVLGQFLKFFLCTNRTSFVPRALQPQCHNLRSFSYKTQYKAWFLGLDSYIKTYLFVFVFVVVVVVVVIILLPASKKHSNHIIPKSPTIFLQIFGSKELSCFCYNGFLCIFPEALAAPRVCSSEGDGHRGEAMGHLGTLWSPETPRKVH